MTHEEKFESCLVTSMSGYILYESIWADHHILQAEQGLELWKQGSKQASLGAYTTERMEGWWELSNQTRSKFAS